MIRNWKCGGLALSLAIAGCGSDDHGSHTAPVDLATLGVDPSTQERCDPIGAGNPCIDDESVTRSSRTRLRRHRD